ncbi:hypothetical protein [Asticcacaulis sp. YBE204]|uniref:hypothetical protein n=1 Tax=Asticcacaulis sp. YBE204 TaxID=1282363 RepID=UPI0003C3FCD5|nr:hypothetical protein [Asticcacaulis sp. YBE204]ESQ77941.1 hypothetical protein AEYBE204_15710 [Asticcacaulis sp. YBE204]
MPRRATGVVPDLALSVAGEGADREQTLLHIVSTLEHLKARAEQVGEQEVAELIGATFTLCLNTYAANKRMAVGQAAQRH